MSFMSVIRSGTSIVVDELSRLLLCKRCKSHQVKCPSWPEAVTATVAAAQLKLTLMLRSFEAASQHLN